MGVVGVLIIFLGFLLVRLPVDMLYIIYSNMTFACQVTFCQEANIHQECDLDLARLRSLQIENMESALLSAGFAYSTS